VFGAVTIAAAGGRHRHGHVEPLTHATVQSACGEHCRLSERTCEEAPMHGLIYLIGLIVVIMAILSFFGLR
jgi:predicted nucleic acid-binding Zn ribbon protein